MTKNEDKMEMMLWPKKSSNLPKFLQFFEKFCNFFWKFGQIFKNLIGKVNFLFFNLRFFGANHHFFLKISQNFVLEIENSKNFEIAMARQYREFQKLKKSLQVCNPFDFMIHLIHLIYHLIPVVKILSLW